MLELNSERAKFMTGPHTPLAGRQYVSPEELVGQTIFRVEGLSEDLRDIPSPTTSSDWDWERTRSSG